MKKSYPIRLLASLSLLAAGTAAANTLPCTEASLSDLSVAGVQLTQIESLASNDDIPIDHCRIAGHTEERTGIDGNAYAIRFELRLPNNWNERFLHQFNGGNDGSVVTAVGDVRSLSGGPALLRGFAVVSSDAGHEGNAHPEAGLAGGSRFGLDPQARSDYGYNAVAVLNPIAEALVEGYYGESIQYRYGAGGSNGGRHALVAASRMPEAFDGLLAGYPGLSLPRAAIQHAWDVQAFKAINGDVRTAYSREDLALVADYLLQQCDALDGLTDGIIHHVSACQQTASLEDLLCQNGAVSGCLSDAQVAALQAVHAGPVNSQGVPLYSDWPLDTGIAVNDWRFWKLESGIPPWGGLPLIAVMGSSSLAQIFTTPPTAVEGDPQSLENYLLNFDFDVDAPKIYSTDGDFTESAMTFMTPTDLDRPRLDGFKDAGGKLIVFHGVSDPVFSVNDSSRWFERLNHYHEGQADQFVRYYTVPGMTHGPGTNPATDDFDFFEELVRWVEQGELPTSIVASTNAANELAMNQLGQIERPLCPYPSFAYYVGGPTESADSFECRF